MCFLSGFSHCSFTFTWRTLLAHLVALHLLHLGSAQLRVVAPSLRVTAIVGQEVVLRCHLSPCKDAWSSDIRWVQHRSFGLVHHYQNGVDLEQMEEYKGRTELLRDGLSDGNLDLRITAVRPSDSDSYSCAVQDGDGYVEAVVNLEVSDPFSEIVHPWKVALAVVITLLLGSFAVIIVFLHRKRAAQHRELKAQSRELEAQRRELAAQSRELERKGAELVELTSTAELSAADLKELAAELVKQTEVVEIRNSQLKRHLIKMHFKAVVLNGYVEEGERRDEDLKKCVADLVEQTKESVVEIEESEIQNSLLKERCEQMELNLTDLKKLAARLGEQVA